MVDAIGHIKSGIEAYFAVKDATNKVGANLKRCEELCVQIDEWLERTDALLKQCEEKAITAGLPERLSEMQMDLIGRRSRCEAVLEMRKTGRFANLRIAIQPWTADKIDKEKEELERKFNEILRDFQFQCVMQIVVSQVEGNRKLDQINDLIADRYPKETEKGTKNKDNRMKGKTDKDKERRNKKATDDAALKNKASAIKRRCSDPEMRQNNSEPEYQTRDQLTAPPMKNSSASDSRANTADSSRRLPLLVVSDHDGDRHKSGSRDSAKKERRESELQRTNSETQKRDASGDTKHGEKATRRRAESEDGRKDSEADRKGRKKEEKPENTTGQGEVAKPGGRSNTQSRGKENSHKGKSSDVGKDSRDTEGRSGSENSIKRGKKPQEKSKSSHNNESDGQDSKQVKKSGKSHRRDSITAVVGIDSRTRNSADFKDGDRGEKRSRSDSITAVVGR